ncbi:MAG: hypothetical protein KF709_00700 [Gemmatimonadaceae bacterium]|nr:hypothetical protein [Gemmatimonadaceae bacterium]
MSAHQKGWFYRLAIVALVAANLGFSVGPTTESASALSLDYACEEYEVGKCRCTDEFALNECQLSGSAQTCADLYPQVCRNGGDDE